MEKDPFSDESLRKLEEWRQTQAAKSSASGSLRGYALRGIALASLYGLASIWGYHGVPEAIVIIAIIAYYCGLVTAKGKR